MVIFLVVTKKSSLKIFIFLVVTKRCKHFWRQVTVGVEFGSRTVDVNGFGVAQVKWCLVQVEMKKNHRGTSLATLYSTKIFYEKLAWLKKN